MKITITLPRSFEKKLVKMLALLEIPESAIGQNLAQWATTDELCSDPGTWTDFHTYQDRATALRVAERIFSAECLNVVELGYRKGKRETRETFLNPILHIQAKKCLDDHALAYTPENLERVAVCVTKDGAIGYGLRNAKVGEAA